MFISGRGYLLVARSCRELVEVVNKMGVGLRGLDWVGEHLEGKVRFFYSERVLEIFDSSGISISSSGPSVIDSSF